jgi:hypothetical protein
MSIDDFEDLMLEEEEPYIELMYVYARIHSRIRIDINAKEELGMPSVYLTNLLHKQFRDLKHD